MPPIKANHSFFKNNFFSIHHHRIELLLFSFSPSYKPFRKQILEFNIPHPNSIFNVPNILGLIYPTTLPVGFSHLRVHKFCHKFQDSLNPIYNCSNDIETTKDYLLHCLNFSDERQSLLQNISIVNPNILSKKRGPTYYYMETIL